MRDLVGVFCTLLEPPNSHIVKFRFVNLRDFRLKGYLFIMFRVPPWDLFGKEKRISLFWRKKKSEFQSAGMRNLSAAALWGDLSCLGACTSFLDSLVLGAFS